MSKFKAKIAKIFEHPISGNIDPKKTLHALEHYGAKIDHTKQNKVKIFLNDKEFVMPLSHGGNLSKDVIVDLRHFLEEAQLTPDKIK